MNNSLGESSLVRHSTPADLSEIFFFLKPSQKEIQSKQAKTVCKNARGLSEAEAGGQLADFLLGGLGFALAFTNENLNMRWRHVCKGFKKLFGKSFPKLTCGKWIEKAAVSSSE